MAKSKKFQKKGGSYNNVQKDQSGTKKDGPAYVPKFRYFAKRTLAAYPDENGVPIYLGEADTEKKFFKKGYCVKVSQRKDCEFFGRIGMAINLAASSIDAGAQTFKERVAPIAGVELDEHANEAAKEKHSVQAGSGGATRSTLRAYASACPAGTQG